MSIVTEVGHAVAALAYTYNQHIGNAIGQDFGEEPVPITPYQKEFGREFLAAIGTPFQVVGSLAYNGLKQTYIDSSYGNIPISSFERDMQKEAEMGKQFDAGMYKAAKFVQDILDEYTTPEERGLVEIVGTILPLRAALFKHEVKLGKQVAKIDVEEMAQLAHHKPISPIFADDLLEQNIVHDVFDIDAIDFTHTTRIELGKLDPSTRAAVLNKLPDEVPEGRVDYIKKFDSDLENYVSGSERLFNGKLTEDLYLINYHDKLKEIGIGKGKRTLQWATHLELNGRMPTIADIHQHLALVEPDWGPRNAYHIIKIPKGTDMTMVIGKAKGQPSLLTGEEFLGGGYQVRFRDFDMNWIIETKDLRK